MRCITNYIKFTVSLITIVLSVFIFSGVNLAYESLQNTINITQENYEEIQINEEETKAIDLEEKTEKILREEINLQEEIWQIEIPVIGLEAPIAEGTTQEVMMKYVGHFENTNLWKGNIGLAAHNRGFPINYFEKVKDLKLGDEIIYITPGGTKTYQVVLSTIIEETDWSYLQETDENKITLITCVSNQPSKRLCVQAVEEIENIK